jgi:DNA-binding transcriptional LysR family regulator
MTQTPLHPVKRRRNSTAILDIGPLRSLIAIAENGGFHRAAGSLSLSQSAVSQHVRRLETVVGKPLLERDGRQARFTVAGEALLNEARQIVAAHDRALERLVFAPARQLVVGVTEHAGDVILPKIVSDLRGLDPTVQVTFRFDRAKPLNAMIDRGALDVAVFVADGDRYAGIPVGSLPLRWCASPDFKRAPTEPLPLIAIESPCAIRSTALLILAENDIEATVVGDAAYLAGAINAARAGLGVTLLAFAGQPPEGLVEMDDLPPASRIPLNARVREGADEQLTSVVMQSFRTALAHAELV